MKTQANPTKKPRRLTPEMEAAIIAEIERRNVIVSDETATRLDRLAAQLRMDRAQLANRLLDRAIREADNDLAMGDPDTFDPGLVDD